MTKPPPSPRTCARPSDSRSIVDPTAWECAEVGRKEGLAFSQDKGTRKGKVSSMRSSLFQKSAKKKSNSDLSAKAFLSNAIFSEESDAEAILRPFSFEGKRTLEYADYGKMNKKLWAKDVFSIFHNAIRCELKDLTCLLKSLRSRGANLLIGDFAGVRHWWQICFAVLLDYFDMESKYLEPWFSVAVESSENNEGCAKAATLLKSIPVRQSEIRELILNATKSLTSICEPPSKDGDPTGGKHLSQNAVLTVKTLDAIVFEVCEYLFDEEEIFTPVICDAYKSEKKEKDVLVAKAIKHISKKGRQGDCMLVLMTKWMTEPKMVKGHIKSIEELTECNYPSLVEDFEEHHRKLIHNFTACCA